MLKNNVDKSKKIKIFLLITNEKSSLFFLLFFDVNQFVIFFKLVYNIYIKLQSEGG